MLVWDDKQQKYIADATPSYGKESLEQFFERAMKEGLAGQELGDAAIFWNFDLGCSDAWIVLQLLLVKAQCSWIMAKNIVYERQVAYQRHTTFAMKRLYS